MTLRAMSMTTVAHGIPQAFRKVQESDERIREELGVTYVKTTEGLPQDQFVFKVNTRSMP